MTEQAPFTAGELERYNRHLIIPGFGIEAQQKLKEAKVLVAGCGGLGSPLLLYLAAAGVGTIGLVDYDLVDQSNLQRQVLFTVDDIGQPKVLAARRRLEALNPYISIVTHHTLLAPDNILEIISGYDVVADGTDNFPARYLINDACVISGKPVVFGAVFQFEGQVSVFNARGKDNINGPNYRDLHPAPPPEGLFQNCVEGGVLGVLPGIIGSLQALEVIKLITGLGESLSGRLYIFDALGFEGRTFTIKRNSGNPLNGKSEGLLSMSDYRNWCGTEPAEKPLKEMSVSDFHALQNSGELFQLIDVREVGEYEKININGELMPLSELADHYARISKDKKVVVHCKTGGRSSRAIRMLEAALGMDNLYNLAGGISAYIDAYRPDLPRY